MNPHGYFPAEQLRPKPALPGSEKRTPTLEKRRYRPVSIACWFSVVVVASLLCAWALDRLYFEYRFGPSFPSGAYASTMVSSTSWGPPQGVPKTYYRIIRESLGCYYPGFRCKGGWWGEPPKTLKDMLEEYGAEIRNNKIYDASEREIRIINMKRPGWHARYRQLIENSCTVFFIDIAATDDDD